MGITTVPVYLTSSLFSQKIANSMFAILVLIGLPDTRSIDQGSPLALSSDSAAQSIDLHLVNVTEVILPLPLPPPTGFHIFPESSILHAISCGVSLSSILNSLPPVPVLTLNAPASPDSASLTPLLYQCASTAAPSQARAMLGASCANSRRLTTATAARLTVVKLRIILSPAFSWSYLFILLLSHGRCPPPGRYDLLGSHASLADCFQPMPRAWNAGALPP